jgi:Protein of unknown function (DUF3309)
MTFEIGVFEGGLVEVGLNFSWVAGDGGAPNRVGFETLPDQFVRVLVGGFSGFGAGPFYGTGYHGGGGLGLILVIVLILVLLGKL